MHNIAVVGDKDSIYGFASIGMSIFPEDDAAGASRTIRKLADNGYAVIFVTEDLASQLGAETAHYAESVMPAIIPIPGVKNNTGMGMKNVSRFVEQAVGSDIISDQ
ncbi:MAG: V-type ATP synthase subunit F [Clostridiales bacterium]|nr:V-type ATP synthase subunit F [Clostridiales bacterium]